MFSLGLKPRLLLVAFLFLVIGVSVFALRPNLIPGGDNLISKATGRSTVANRLQQFSAGARSRLQPHFARAGVLYPPHKVILVGLKQVKRLEVYAANEGGKMKFLRSYEILRASGTAGPKLRYGDYQVPEGFYKVESLNPNSAFHLALRVNYPNTFDRENAEREGRENLGGDIMIHGSDVSVGCLAMGDEAAEDLFVLAAEMERENIDILLCPADFRRGRVLPPPNAPQWTATLYERLENALTKLEPDA